MLLLSYKVRARNTSADSENRIHDDEIAASYGFRGGLVPGVTVYGYMTAPIVSRFGMKWLESGSMQVWFLEPFYDGEQVNIRAVAKTDEHPIKATIRAEREDGTLCASGVATIGDNTGRNGETDAGEFPEAPLPDWHNRPEAQREAFVVGSTLGTLNERLDLFDTTALNAIEERLTLYRGTKAVAHPSRLLSLSNEALARNFKLGPWIHASSELINRSTARDGDQISVRGRIRDCFERKGHEFVVLDLVLLANKMRVVQRVRHTAIYKPRQRIK